MKISNDKFEEILSAYLDGEASEAELDLLSECINSDKEMSDKFQKACRIHLATCAIYGKKVNFPSLKEVCCPFVIKKRTSRKRLFFEWALVACLIVSSASLSYVYVSDGSNNQLQLASNTSTSNNLLQNIPESTITTECVYENGRLYSLIKLINEKPIVVMSKF